MDSASTAHATTSESRYERRELTFPHCPLQIVSLAALGVQLARKDQRKLAQKTVKAEGVYFLPHSPILAPVMVSCYCIVAIATALVLRAYLWRGSALVVIQRVSTTSLPPLPGLTVRKADTSQLFT